MGEALSVRATQPRQFSARYGARHPWLAPWPRAGLYLIWRGLVAGLRPAMVLLLLCAAAVFAWQAFSELPRPDLSALSPSEQVSAALHDAVPGGIGRHAFWTTRIETCLETPPRSLPDIGCARAFASSYVAIRGREALALELLAEGRRPERVEAQLRALPAWDRERRIGAALAQASTQGAAKNLQPPGLVFAPEDLIARLNRAEALFGPALEEAEAWFADPDGRALSLRSAAGLSTGRERLYGDVRGAVVHGCALAGMPGRRVGQCRVGFLPKPQADPVMAGLALAAAGADPERQVGARIAKAAWAAGRLDPELAALLALGPDPDLGREAVLAALMPVLAEAGTAWSEPTRYRERVRRAAIEAQNAAGIDIAARDRVFDALTGMRRDVGALSTVRMADAIDMPEAAERLAQFVEAVGPQMAALHSLTGSKLLDAIAQGEPETALDGSVLDWPRHVQRDIALASGALLAAIIVLKLTLYSGFRRRRGGAPGVFERVDAVMSRLILGRNV